MKILDCLPLMTKAYPSRVVDSIFKENIPKGDEHQLKEQIEQNFGYLVNEKRIRETLNFSNLKRAWRIQTRSNLNLILENPDLLDTERNLLFCVQSYET